MFPSGDSSGAKDNTLLSFAERQSLRDGVVSSPRQETKKQLVALQGLRIEAEILSDVSNLICWPWQLSRSDATQELKDRHRKEIVKCALFNSLRVHVPVGQAGWLRLREINDVLSKGQRTISAEEAEKIRIQVDKVKSANALSRREGLERWFLVEYSSTPARNPNGLPDALLAKTTDQYGQPWTLWGDDRASGAGGYLVETAQKGNRKVTAFPFEEYQQLAEKIPEETDPSVPVPPPPFTEKSKNLLDKIKNMFGTKKNPFDK